jgi:hypothetical protein
MMAEPTDEQIRRRAYQLWEQHGRPEGRDVQFWLRAKDELRAPEPYDTFTTLNELT